MVLIGAAVSVIYRREHPSTASESPFVTPAPAAVATPAATPTPAPIPAATPLPPFELSKVDPRALPRQVVLLKPVDFVLVAQGKQIGSAHANTGVQVDLVGVVSDSQVLVRMGQSQQTIPAADTDVEARVRALSRYVATPP